MPWYIYTGIFVGVFSQPSESFGAVTNCVCSGEVAIYECTVCGEFATVWEGSAFDSQCTNREITLTHSDFGTQAAFGTCGNIEGHGLYIESGCYISQVNVPFDAGLVDRTVECSSDNGTHTRKLGQAVLHVSTGI